MRNVEQMAIVVQLACLTNQIGRVNPRARTVFVCTGDTWLTPAIDADDPRAVDRGQGRSIDAGQFGVIEGKHPRTCICHGSGLIPGEGLSRLQAEVQATWEPQ